MELEELKREVFLLEHGFYDREVLQFANKHKPRGVNYFIIISGQMLAVRDDSITTLLSVQRGQNIFGEDLLKEWRKKWFFARHPELKLNKKREEI